ncbi:MAG: NAD-dependent epimerase/dehydratase family protein [Pseudomonadota bacterium]
MPQKVLITGGNGNLGRLVAARFIGAGSGVISFDLPGTMPAQGVLGNYAGDIRDTAPLARILDEHAPDAVIHLASLLSGSSEADPHAAWEINATASINLMHMMHERGIGPFVFASTVATYASTFPRHLPEDAPQWPENVYGATKVAVERMGVWLKTARGFDFRCLRFPMVLSPFAPPGAVTAYPGHAVNAAARAEPFAFPVAAETGMSTLFLDDVTHSLFEITRADRAALTRHAYNLHGFHFTAAALAARIKAEWPEARLSFEPDAHVDALISGWPDKMEDATAREDWGWRPAYDFEACVAEVIKLARDKDYSISPKI